jgi:hypothetical protein
MSSQYASASTDVNSPTATMTHHSPETPMNASAALSHSMPSDDLDNPMNWPLHRKLYTTACSWFYAFAMYAPIPSAYAHQLT